MGLEDGSGEGFMTMYRGFNGFVEKRLPETLTG